MEQTSRAWYFLPILFGLLGAFFVWLAIKNRPHPDAALIIRRSFYIGMIYLGFPTILFIIFLISGPFL